MSLADVTNDFKNILNRRDLTASQTTTFLSHGLARVQRTLRIPNMERAQILNADYDTIQSFQLPGDLLQIIDVVAGGRPLEHRTMRQVLAATNSHVPMPPTGVATLPHSYARLGASLFLWPFLPQGGQIVTTYYGTFQPLVNPTDENELTQAAPDLLVYAALTFAADMFSMDQGQSWEARYQALLMDVQDEARQLDATGGPTVVAPTHGDY